MKFLVHSLLFAVTCAVVSSEELYTNKYDNVDLDEILQNARLYKKYFNCINGNGPCTPDAREVKARLPEALKTNCSKCTKAQQDGIKKTLTHLVEKEPGDFEIFLKTYDPEGKFTYLQEYREKHEKNQKKE